MSFNMFGLFVIGLVFCVLSSCCSFVSSSAMDCLDRLVCEMTYRVREGNQRFLRTFLSGIWLVFDIVSFVN